MTKNGDPKDLFYRYVDSVGRHLPRKWRDDIQMEIMSLLEDALEDRTQSEGRELDEEMVVEVLKEFGPPEKVAASYLPNQYLIGPRMYPALILALQIFFVVIVFQVLAAVVVGVSTNLSDFEEMITALLGRIPGFLTMIFSTLGSIVLTLAILDRVLPHSDEEAKLTAWMKLQGLMSTFVKRTDDMSISKTWNPRVLKEIKKADLVSPGKLLFEICLLIGMLVWFNFFPQWVGAANHTQGSGWVFIPLLSASFSSVYLPWINLFWAVSMGLEVIILLRGSFTQLTRWFQVGLKTLALIILASFLTGPLAVGLNPEYAAFHDLSTAVQTFAKGDMIPGLVYVFKIVVIINLVIHGLVWLKMVLGLTLQAPTFPLTFSKKT